MRIQVLFWGSADSPKHCFKVCFTHGSHALGRLYLVKAIIIHRLLHAKTLNFICFVPKTIQHISPSTGLWSSPYIVAVNSALHKLIMIWVAPDAIQQHKSLQVDLYRLLLLWRHVNFAPSGDLVLTIKNKKQTDDEKNEVRTRASFRRAEIKYQVLKSITCQMDKPMTTD